MSRQEDKEVTGIARLLKAMYGTRDAAQCFDSFAESSMQILGFTIGVFNPSIYWNEERDLVCVRHGDDLTQVILSSRCITQPEVAIVPGINRKARNGTSFTPEQNMKTCKL